VGELHPQPGLRVLEKRTRLESVEPCQDEHDPGLAGVDRFLEAGLQGLAVVLSAELPRCPQADDARGHVVHPLDHVSSSRWSAAAETRCNPRAGAHTFADEFSGLGRSLDETA